MSVHVSQVPLAPGRSPTSPTSSTFAAELARPPSSLLISNVAPVPTTPGFTSRPLLDASSYSPFPTIPGSGHSRDPFGLNAYLLNPQDALWDYMAPAQSVQPGLDAVDMDRAETMFDPDSVIAMDSELGGVKRQRRKSLVQRASSMMFRRSSPLTAPPVLPSDEGAETDDSQVDEVVQIIEQPPKAKQRSPGRRSLRRVLHTRRQSEGFPSPPSPVPELPVPPVPEIPVQHMTSQEDASSISSASTTPSMTSCSSVSVATSGSPASSSTTLPLPPSTPMSSRSQSTCSAISSASSDSSDGIKTPADAEDVALERRMVPVDLANALESAEAASRSNIKGSVSTGGWRSWLGGKRGSKIRDSASAIMSSTSRSTSSNSTSGSPVNLSPELRSIPLDPSPHIISRSVSPARPRSKQSSLPPEPLRARSAQQLRRMSMSKLNALRTPSPHPLALVLLRQYSNLPGEVASSIPASRRVFPRSVNSHRALTDSPAAVVRGGLRTSLAIQSVISKVDQGILPEIVLLNLNARVPPNSRAPSRRSRPRGVRDFISRPPFEERHLVFYGNDTFSHVSMARPGNAVWDLDFSKYMLALSKVEEPPPVEVSSEALGVGEGWAGPVPRASIGERDEVDEVLKLVVGCGEALSDRPRNEPSGPNAKIEAGDRDQPILRLPKLDAIRIPTATTTEVEIQATEEIIDLPRSDLTTDVSAFINFPPTLFGAQFPPPPKPPMASSFRRSVVGNRSPKMWESSDDSDDERLSVTLDRSRRASSSSSNGSGGRGGVRGGNGLHRAKSEISLRPESPRTRTHSQPDGEKTAVHPSGSGDRGHPSLRARPRSSFVISSVSKHTQRPTSTAWSASPLPTSLTASISSSSSFSKYLDPEEALEQVTRARERRDEFKSGELARRADAEKVRERIESLAGVAGVKGDNMKQGSKSAPTSATSTRRMSLVVPGQEQAKAALMAKRRSTPNLLASVAESHETQVMSTRAQPENDVADLRNGSSSQPGSRLRMRQASSSSAGTAATVSPPRPGKDRRRAKSYYDTPESQSQSQSRSLFAEVAGSKSYPQSPVLKHAQRAGSLPRPSSFYDLPRQASPVTHPHSHPPLPMPMPMSAPSLPSGLLSLNAAQYFHPSLHYAPQIYGTQIQVQPQQTGFNASLVTSRPTSIHGYAYGYSHPGMQAFNSGVVPPHAFDPRYAHGPGQQMGQLGQMSGQVYGRGQGGSSVPPGTGLSSSGSRLLKPVS